MILFKEQNVMVGDIDLKSLNPNTRVLLTTNGTLTRTLESIMLEKIEVCKINEVMQKGSDLCERDRSLLNLSDNEQVLYREIFLQGKDSLNNYVYAASYIAVEKLPKKFQDELLNSKVPIGYIWLKYRMPLYKKFVDYSISSVGDLSSGFGLRSSEQLFRRTYVVYSDDQPSTIITEKFPCITSFLFN